MTCKTKAMAVDSPEHQCKNGNPRHAGKNSPVRTQQHAEVQAWPKVCRARNRLQRERLLRGQQPRRTTCRARKQCRATCTARNELHIATSSTGLRCKDNALQNNTVHGRWPHMVRAGGRPMRYRRCRGGNPIRSTTRADEQHGKQPPQTGWGAQHRTRRNNR